MNTKREYPKDYRVRVAGKLIRTTSGTVGRVVEYFIETDVCLIHFENGTKDKLYHARKLKPAY